MIKRALPKSLVGVIVLFASVAFLAAAFPTQGATGVPKLLSYQGRLYDSAGNLLGGTGTTYCFRFSIYDDPAGGSKLWPAGTPNTMTSTVRVGVFNLMVGDTTRGGDALTYNFQDNDTTYLNVEVATTTGSCGPFQALLPRQRITATGYAINAGTVGGYTPAQNATGDQIPVLSSGNLTLGGVDPQLNATGTNTLTLQGGSGTGNIQFFSASNYVTATGTVGFAGNLGIAGATVLQGLTFVNATGSGNFQAAGINNTPIGTGGAATGIFTNVTTTGTFTAQGAGRFESGLSALGTTTSSASFALSALDVQGTTLLSVRNDGIITLGKSGASSTIQIGIGTGPDTINIGTGGTTADTITMGNASVPTTFLLQSGATSTTPFTLNANSFIDTNPALVLNATGLLAGTVFQVNGASSTPLISVGRASNGLLDWSRVAIGGSATSTRDQLYVHGRINSSWQTLSEDFLGGASSITADSRGVVTYDEDAECIWAAQDTAGASTIRARAGGAAATAGDGCNTGSGGVIGIRVNENPVIETRVLVSSSTDQFIRIGFNDGAIGADSITDTTNGIYFRKKAASTTWEAVTRSGGAETMFNTGITVSNSVLQTLRIEIEDGASPIANFYVNGALATSTGTNIPVATMGWTVTNGISTASATRDLVIDWIKVWHDDPPGAKTTGPVSPTTATAPFEVFDGADVAEYYRTGGAIIPPGSVVRIKDPASGGGLAAVELSATPYDERAIGIVSTYAPKITLADPGDEAAIEVALVGRVPVRVTTKNGSAPIQAGDYLAASDIPGVAMKATRTGIVLGMAIESYAGSNETNTLMFVNRIWYDGTMGRSTSSVATSPTEPNVVERFGGLLLETLQPLADFVTNTFSAGRAAILSLFVRDATVVPDGTVTVPAGENQISGQSVLPAGLQEIFVPNTRVTHDSKIFLTPTTDLETPLIIAAKLPGQGFRVRSTNPPQTDVLFDWLMLQTYTASGGATSAPNAPPPGTQTTGTPVPTEPSATAPLLESTSTPSSTTTEGPPPLLEPTPPPPLTESTPPPEPPPDPSSTEPIDPPNPTPSSTTP